MSLFLLSPVPRCSESVAKVELFEWGGGKSSGLRYFLDHALIGFCLRSFVAKHYINGNHIRT